MKQLKVLVELLRSGIKLVASSAVAAVMRQYLGSVELQCMACKALCKMAAQGPENREEIASSGGIEAAVAAMQAHPGHAELQAAACRVLADVAFESHEIQARVSACGGLEAMAVAMRRYLDPGGKRQALSVMQTAASGKKAVLAKRLITTAALCDVPVPEVDSSSHPA